MMRFFIRKEPSGFMWRLFGSNGSSIARSEGVYSTRPSCIRAVRNIVQKLGMGATLHVHGKRPFDTILPTGEIKGVA